VAASGQREVELERGVGRKKLNELDDFETLSRLKPEECLHKPKAFDCFARRSSELVVQLRNECGIRHLAPSDRGTVMAFLSKREGLARKVDTAAIEAESLGLTTATLILRMARLEIDRAEPDVDESMPRNVTHSKPN
jgi:hypothetical protein